MEQKLLEQTLLGQKLLEHNFFEQKCLHREEHPLLDILKTRVRPILFLFQK